MNATMKLHGITEATFPWIMRGSLVILCKGRFVSAARLARLPLGAQGYILMQDDMKDFVTSKPAAGALFAILMGDLSQFSAVGFREKIESYADVGGDGGLTRATMRLACGLQQELHTPRSAGGPVHAPGTPGLDIGESVGSRRVPFVVQSEQDKMLRYHVSLLTHCLSDGIDLCSGTRLAGYPRVKAKDWLGVLQQLKTWGVLEGTTGQGQARRPSDPDHLWLVGFEPFSAPVNLRSRPTMVRKPGAHRPPLQVAFERRGNVLETID